MKTRACCISLILVALVLIPACQTPPTDKYAGSETAYSKAPPRYLVVGVAGAEVISPEDRVVIDDEAFVRDFLAALNGQPTMSFRHYWLIGPYPLVFVDADWNVFAAFRYSRSSKPDGMIWSSWARRQGEAYRVEPGVPARGMNVREWTAKLEEVVSAIE
jgi:hypothetical protein